MVPGRVWLAIAALAAASVFPTAAKAQPQPSSEAVWQQFLQWLPEAPPVDSPPVLIGQYRSRLIAGGVSETEADRQVDIVRRSLRERSDGWRAMFNNIYASSTPGYSIQPNALLISTVEDRKSGRALDIGMGQGRNSVFLALKGWDVTGFDISDEGIKVAHRNAERAGVKLNAVRESEAAFDYGTDRWDLVVFMHEPFPITSAAYVERLRKSMKAGGIIVIESFGEEEIVAGRPPTAIDPGKLKTAFKDFNVLLFEDTMALPDWGGPAKRRLVRMVAEKRQ